MLLPRLRVLSLALLAGCSAPFEPGGRVCTLELRSTIVVEVTDAKTGAPAPVGSTVIVRGATFYDSVFVTAPLHTPSTAYLAWENQTKVGRYTVEVRKPGYLGWIKSDVDVRGDECHNGPGPLVQVALQPRT